MARVFDGGESPGSEDSDALTNVYVEKLLARDDFWAIAAFSAGHLIGGLTAFTLPMTRSESSEVFVYDIAVRPDCQRRGVGRMLMNHLQMGAAAVGCSCVFVAADDEDAHALDFYRALGGAPADVTMFTFSPRSPGQASPVT
jgi:aminoglycoside 3-N-acetyltransferase I